jgi:hypothetical protein
MMICAPPNPRLWCSDVCAGTTRGRLDYRDHAP